MAISKDVNLNVGVTGNYKKEGREVVNSANQIGDSVQQAGIKGAAGFKQLAGAFTSLVVAKHVTRLVGSMIRPSMDLQVALADLSSATGVTGTRLADMRNAALEAAAATKFTPTEALESMRRLRLATNTTDQAIQALKPTLQMAQALMGNDVVAAAKLSGQIIKTFGIEADQTHEKLGKLVAVSRFAGVPVKELAGAFDLLGISAKTINASYEDALAIIGLTVQAGLPARRAVTGLFAAFSKLLRADIREKLDKQLNIRLIDAATGKWRAARDIMVDFAQAMQGANRTQVQNIVIQALTERGSKTFLATMQRLADGVKDAEGNVVALHDAFADLDKRMQGSETLLAEISKIGMAPLQRQIELLEQAMNRLKANAFQKFLDVSTPVIGALASILNAISLAHERGEFWATSLVFVAKHMVLVAAAAGVVLSALLAVAGVKAIFGAALAFMGAKGVAVLTRLLFGGLIPALGKTSKFIAGTTIPIAASAKGVSVLTKVWRVFGIVMRGVFRAILGPIGLLLLAAEFLPGLLQTFWKFFKGNDIQKKSEQDASSIKTQADVLKSSAVSINAMISDFAEHTKAIGEYTKEFAKQVGSAFPEIPTKGFERVHKLIESLAGSGVTSKDEAAGQRDLLGRIAETLQEAGTKGFSESRIQALQTGMSMLIGRLGGSVGPQQAKMLGEFQEEWQAALEGARTNPLQMQARIQNVDVFEQIMSNLRMGASETAMQMSAAYEVERAAQSALEAEQMRTLQVMLDGRTEVTAVELAALDMLAERAQTLRMETEKLTSLYTGEIQKQHTLAKTRTAGEDLVDSIFRNVGETAELSGIAARHRLGDELDPRVTHRAQQLRENREVLMETISTTLQKMKDQGFKVKIEEPGASRTGQMTINEDKSTGESQVDSL